MVQIKPMENEIRSIIHDDFVHLPDHLLALFGGRDKFLLFIELIDFWDGTFLIPPATVRNKQLAKGINGIVKVKRRAQQGQLIISRDFVPSMLGDQHGLKLDIDVDLFQQLLDDLGIFTRKFDIRRALDFDPDLSV
jgi:hypothetical protein